MKANLLAGMGVAFGLVVAACGGSNNNLPGGKTAAQCPSPDTVPCGYGCVAATTTCCDSKSYSPEWDIGTFECPGTAVAQCVANTGSCGASQYCCSTNGSFSSIDCKDGTVVCNQNCVPVGSKCCSMTDPTNCGTVGGVNPPSGGNDATTSGMNWPDDPAVQSFPAWHELDGKITSIDIRENDAVETDYYITAKIDGNLNLVTNYIALAESQGFSLEEQDGAWTTVYVSTSTDPANPDIDVETDLEIPCTAGYIPNTFQECAGPVFHITVMTGTSGIYVVAILNRYDESQY